MSRVPSSPSSVIPSVDADPSSRDATTATDATQRAIPAAHAVSADPAREWTLVIHAGAGARPQPLAPDRAREARAGLEAAYRAGEQVLATGGSAVDAVVAAVAMLEDDPQFNAGRGAALTTSGQAETDAAVMTGDGHAGAVAGSRYARNPVRAARAVKDTTEHVLVSDPSAERLRGWGVQQADPSYFMTDLRRRQLERHLAARTSGPTHGTVGAVAKDAQGAMAAATSTGGITGQEPGRIGDSPVVGAGTFARNGVVAVSCTGHGEAFLEGVAAHEVDARIRLGGQDLAAAACGTLDDEVGARGSDGGLIAVGQDGTAVIALDSQAIFAAYRDGDEIRTLV